MQMNAKPFDPGHPFKPEGAIVSVLVLMAEHLLAGQQSLSADEPKGGQEDAGRTGELAAINRRGLHHFLQRKLGAWNECERICIAVAALQARIDKLAATDPRKGTDFSKLLLKASWISLCREQAQRPGKQKQMPEASSVEMTELAKRMIAPKDPNSGVGFGIWIAIPDTHGSWKLEEIEGNLGEGRDRSTAIISDIFQFDISRCRLYWKYPPRSTIIIPRSWLLKAVYGGKNTENHTLIMGKVLKRLDRERKIANSSTRAKIIVFLREVNRSNRNPVAPSEKVLADLKAVVNFREALAAFRKTKPSRKKWADFWKGSPSRKAVDPQDKWKIGW